MPDGIVDDFTVGEPPADAKSGDVIPTIDMEFSSSPDGKPSEDKKGAEDKKDEGTKKPGEEEEPEKKEDPTQIDDKLTEFHKHPDWQRMVKERDEAKDKLIRLEATVDALKTASKPTQTPKEEAPTYKDITTMKPDEIREWQEDDPIGYAANLYAQVLHEVRQQIKTEQTKEQQTNSIGKTYSEFEGKNPDFRKMWDAGEIKKFMDANPGHNAISAYHELTLEKRIQAEREKAAKEAEEKVTKNFQAKKAAHTADGQPARRGGSQEDQDLKDTKAKGGLNAVLANKLKFLRAGRA